MEVQLKPTNEYTRVQGAECRLWRGASEDGTPITLAVAACWCPDEAFRRQYEREMNENRPTRPQFIREDLITATSNGGTEPLGKPTG